MFFREGFNFLNFHDKEIYCNLLMSKICLYFVCYIYFLFIIVNLCVNISCVSLH